MQWLDTSDDFGIRIKLLQKVDLFKGASLPSLIPVANNLVVMRYKLGELIFKDGVEPKGIFFIKRGSVLVGLLDHTESNVQYTPHCWFRKRNPAFKRINNLADPTRGPVEVVESSRVNRKKHTSYPAPKGTLKIKTPKKIFMDKNLYSYGDGKPL